MANETMASSPKITPGKNQGSVNRVSLNVVENGFTANVGFEDKPAKKGQSCCYEPGKEYVLTNRDQVIGFVIEALGLTEEAPPHWSRK